MPFFFGGLTLDTDFDTDQLQSPGDAVSRALLTVRCVDGPAPDDEIVHRSAGRYRLSTGRAGDNWVFRSCFADAFVLDRARQQIDCHIVSADGQAWRDVLFRRVLPRVATTYGALALHAAAIATDERCLLLLGQSGAGKSTLTTFCAKAGWAVLSDDTSLLWADDRITVEPVQRGTGVWDDVRDALSLPAAHCTPMPGYGGRKWRFDPPGVAPRGRRPSAVLLLERSAHVVTPRLDRLTHDEVLASLMAQNIPFLPETRPSATTAQAFGRVAMLARRMPGFRLVYPDGYAGLPAVEELMRSMPLDAAR